VREPAEAEALDAMGVAWIGFNFHPGSSRYVAPGAAAPMIRALKQARSVGVFVDAPIDHVISISKSVGLDFVQLHGSEDWDYVRRMPAPVIKAVPHTRLADWGGLKAPLQAALAAGSAAPLAYFLVDTAAGNAFGGSGLAFDWGLLAAHPLPLPVILAGGLGPDNLEAALAVRPFALDLNSKVEIAPGKKDLAKISACLEAAARAHRE
jgi:phosphoribosylanthranilate isomerase